ncbi:MAG: divergent polysaccharide deacetylase family protein [Vulcanimicrobiota bacterium]
MAKAPRKKKAAGTQGRSKLAAGFIATALFGAAAGSYLTLKAGPTLERWQAYLQPTASHPSAPASVEPPPPPVPLEPEANQPEVRPAPPAPQTPPPKPAERPRPTPTPATVASPPLPDPKPTPLAEVPVKGRLAIVIDDCGNSPNEGFIALDTPISLAVLPHVPYAHEVAQRAAASGKCVILHLPMEAEGASDPGPGTLKTSMTPQELETQIRSDFDAVPGIVGVNNHQGSKASANEAVMRLVLAEAKRRQIFYLDSRTTGASVAPRLAPAAGVQLLQRDIFLDNQDAVEPILAQLAQAEKVAETHGSAIAIGHPRANTLAALEQWIPEARARGLQFVYLTELNQGENTYAQAR